MMKITIGRKGYLTTALIFLGFSAGFLIATFSNVGTNAFPLAIWIAIPFSAYLILTFLLWKRSDFALDVNLMSNSVVVMAIVYLACMVLLPLAQSGASWEHVQEVWYRWQSLNVGMLAFLSSVLIFNIANYRNEGQRKRDFRAVQMSLLPVLHDLSKYSKECAKLLIVLQQLATVPPQFKAAISAKLPRKPDLPSDFFKITGRVIECAEEELGEELAYLSWRVQLQETRLNQLVSEAKVNSAGITRNWEKSILLYIFRLAEIKLHLDSHLRATTKFPFHYDSAEVSKIAIHNVLESFGIFSDNIPALKPFVDRKFAEVDFRTTS